MFVKYSLNYSTKHVACLVKSAGWVKLFSVHLLQDSFQSFWAKFDY